MNTSRRDERGATAVLVALLATALFAVAAIGVDLGNVWARERGVQGQVDISAISAGWKLPAVTEAEKQVVADEVANYLMREVNEVMGQVTITGADLYGPTSGGEGDGQIYFTNNGETMRVVAPTAEVGLLFGGLIGPSELSIGADATVEVRSPLPNPGDVFPFVMPDQCPYGPGMADTGPGPADTTGDFTPTNSRNGTVASISATTVPENASPPFSLTVELTDLPNNSSGGEIQFQRGGAVLPVVVDWTPDTTNSDDERTETIEVPAQVLDTPGVWNVYGFVKGKHTTNSMAITVAGTPAADDDVACGDSASGQYGQMDSPREGVGQLQIRFALNIALGLDHQTVPWPAAPAPECGQKNQDPPTEGVQDEEDPPAAPNCVLPQTGNDGPSMLEGMITGIDSEGVPGRLDTANGHTRSGCGTNVTVKGEDINNDKLSCFMLTGDSLGVLTQETTDESVFEGILSPEILDSPRFVWIPVIHAATRDDIDNNTFFAIKRFVPGFITDESAAATNGASDGTADNGVELNTGNSIRSIQVFTFNPLALPSDHRAPTMPYDPEAGKEIRLID